MFFSEKELRDKGFELYKDGGPMEPIEYMARPFDKESSTGPALVTNDTSSDDKSRKYVVYLTTSEWHKPVFKHPLTESQIDWFSQQNII